ncbi:MULTISPECIES: 4-amino-4-deoxy-L-arabinose-phosphoundecaprenol flippase subunit ArnE [Providencia]|uniref:Probable 4-amino-4-deoxy-L-arabinose-phosphoundecaprenol flippase subunit ArnE n=1 Tax=Providencia heimbachae ATCC 35613 TaxID=1354272 RepID=A0A1B7K227_9GAMM|nr:4-amino-4-deoxy-L-arabinose-phosphoundecaprenol flippase subunit ArnE [Providencia heimbachae]MBP6124129.1 EamA family transporter [Providencia sp.]MDD9341180.1 4-amino-4-deoxy-L-arabinose-phosphoundecaprenol flippase subunit ArnE [Providencia heimbachae]NIH23003.1 EamA family transporter [Providencia heimbachae]OAT54210.1 polymyxin resistance sucrose-6 phosphate hydrolase [Providencia heimbachae ATCC 35613]QCJ70490.1 4-amino-4-deoxy-L-arabinose-phospho-UDP flippase [Providencia heimbachae]
MTGQLLLLLLVSVLTCTGQIAQKQAVVSWQGDRVNKTALAIRWLVLAVFMLGLGMLFWLKLLESMPLSIAYPMLSINFVLVTLIGQFVYHEQTGLSHWLGVAAIMFGILLMSISI